MLTSAYSDRHIVNSLLLQFLVTFSANNYHSIVLLGQQSVKLPVNARLS